VSPSDGKILHFGTLENNTIEQVKGITYSANDFLGNDAPTSPNPENNLYYAVIYLAPGDYHRFHAPADFVASQRRHFHGQLYSVSPYIAKRLRDLFVLNERVCLLGRWNHGFMAYVPVGATNVGSIIVYGDDKLKTNLSTREYIALANEQNRIDAKNKDIYPPSNPNSSLTQTPSLPHNPPFDYADYTQLVESPLCQPGVGFSYKKGQEVGGFMLGSTIVLVFEAPKNFNFEISTGQRVLMGQTLGSFS
ncbi:Phosphatidylserine decarboxylase proenzyme, partial [Smittium mucronatum]